MASVTDLIETRNAAAAAYYEGSPTMTDDAFDALTSELSAQGVEQEVGHGYEPMGRKVRHDAPMLSLDKVRTIGQITDWIASTGTSEFLIQHKYDGLAVSVKYDARGKLISAVTRGNGIIGEDVTEAVRAMTKNGRLPAKLTGVDGPVEVRGEIMVTSDDFQLMNDELLASELAVMTAKRNAAAGILRRHDTTDAGKYLSLFVYDFPDEIEAGDLIGQGFTLAHQESIVGDEQTIIDAIQVITDERLNLTYEIDGIVIKVRDKSVRSELGTSSTAPRWAVAYKFPNVAQETTLRSVTWSTGRTGRIVPVAQFDEILVGGVRITNATLHNYDYLRHLKLKLGDTIAVTRSNDVIPYVMGRVGKHPEEARKFKVPSRCPNCGEDVRVKGKDIVCSTDGACNVISGVVYSLTMLDVLGVSSALIGALRRSGKRIESVLDLLAVKEKRIAKLDGYGETSARNAVEAMRVVWEASLPSWVAAIGIPNIGYSTARILQDRYSSLQELGHAKFEDLIELPNIGDAKAQVIVNASAKILTWALRLEEEFGYSPKPFAPAEPEGNAFEGKNVVLTGKFPSLNRQEAASYVVAQGGTVQGAVSRTTNILIAGENAGSKIAKAETIEGIQIMSATEFEEIVL